MLNAAVGFVVGAAIGVAVGGGFAALNYGWALSGECGCEMQRHAQSMSFWAWVGSQALSAGLIGGVFGAIAATMPIAMIIIGGVGIALSALDIYNTGQIMINQTGITWCTITRILLDVAFIALSVYGIGKAISEWRASGSPFEWGSGSEPGKWGARRGTSSGADYEEYIRQQFGNPSNKNYIVNNGERNVYFDAWDAANRILIDAKSSSGNSIYDLVLTEPWASDSILSEAEAQVAAAQSSGTKVEWYVNNLSTADTLQTFFDSMNIPINTFANYVEMEGSKAG